MGKIREFEMNIDIDVTNTTFTTIPANSYVHSVDNMCGTDYEVYYKGKKINDVYGIIRYVNYIDEEKWKEPVITNWQEEFGD